MKAMKAMEADKLVKDMSDAILKLYHDYQFMFREPLPEPVEQAASGFYHLHTETSGWGVMYRCLEIPVSEIKSVFEDCVGLLAEYYHVDEKYKDDIEAARKAIDIVGEHEEEIHRVWFGSEEDIKLCAIHSLQFAIQQVYYQVRRWKQDENLDVSQYNWEEFIREALTAPEVKLEDFRVHEHNPDAKVK